MGRFIAIVLLLIILRLAFKNFTGQLKAAVFGPPQSRPGPQNPKVASQTLVQCAHCGTYIASTQALKAQGVGAGEVFCSEGCRRGGG